VIRISPGTTGARKQAVIEVPVIQPNRIIEADGGIRSARTEEAETSEAA
jgi:hypothetical protein